MYELVDEEQYEELVRQRRQRDDFVVDDGESASLPLCVCVR